MLFRSDSLDRVSLLLPVLLPQITWSEVVVRVGAELGSERQPGDGGSARFALVRTARIDGDDSRWSRPVVGSERRRLDARKLDVPLCLDLL